MLTKPISAPVVVVERSMEAFLERAGMRERAKIEKHLAACDGEAVAGHGKSWRRLALAMSTLAPLPVKSAGPKAWQFFVPDGKYRLQLFALEDPGDGTLRVYLPDIMAEALSAKVLSKSGRPDEYAVRGTTQRLQIESLTSANSVDPPEHLKHMLGWNRKALKLTISTTEVDEALTAALEGLMALAGKRWPAPVAGA